MPGRPPAVTEKGVMGPSKHEWGVLSFPLASTHALLPYDRPPLSICESRADSLARLTLWSRLSPLAPGLIIRAMSDTQPSTDRPRDLQSVGAAAGGFGAGLAAALVELLQTALIAGLLFLAVNLVTARIRVEGSSMEPSLHDGEFVIVNRLAYRWSPPMRGDIIVFRFPLDPSRRFIKRVIGLPGDMVQAKDGVVYVNGHMLDEPYIAAPPRYDGEWRVGANELFVLGDNRNNSDDSENWGPLPSQDVIGKAVLVYWPPSDVGVIPHYQLTTAIP